MNELLNSGIGMPHYSPYNHPEDPDDKRTTEEKIVDGCLGQIIAMGIAIIVLFLLTMATSCSSHKSVCGVTEETADSLATIIEQTEQVERIDTSLTQTEATTATHSASTATATSEDTETVNEIITETTDAQGNTSKTTNRTTTRRSASQQTQTDLLEQYSHEIAMMLYLSRLDSMYRASLSDIEKHYATKDSVEQVREVVRSHPVSYSSVFGGLIVVVFVVVILSRLYKYITGK